MYFEFFGLTTSPFNNTPDPRFFYNTPDHEEALASLLYAVEERKGFVLVSGEVGAGKTLLSRIVLNKLSNNVKSALITHTRLTGAELLASICREFEIDLKGKSSAAEYMRALEDFLLEQYARNKLAVVIIDEAQNLPFEALEELRMLGNLEADDAKLLQVLLLGQPEVQEAFRHPALKQTYQRLFRTFHLKALDRKLTQGYIEHRLEIAGLQRGKRIFDIRALDAIFEYTEGTPRLINQICDNALLAAYSDSKKIVTAEMIRDVIDQMMSLSSPSRSAEASTSTQSASPSAAASAPAARTPTKPQPGPSLADATGRIARQDEYLRGVAERLDAFERSLRDAKQHVHTLDNKQQNVQHDVASARRLHEEAAELFGSVTTNVREAEREMKEMLERARRTADAIQSRAMANLGTSQKQNVLLREQTRSALDEVQNFTKEQQTIIARLLEDGRKEVEAAREFRKQAAELCQRAIESQSTAEQRFRIAIDEAGEATRRTELDAKALLAETREQNIALQDQLRKLLGEVQTKNDAASQRAAEFLAQQRKEVEKAQHYFDDYAQKLGERAEQLKSESSEVLSFLKNEARAVIEQIHQVRSRTQARAEEVGSSAEEFLGDITKRIESAHARITEIVETAEERIKNATAGLADTKDRILADAESCQSRSGKLLGQTEELLSTTREQCKSLLAEMRSQAEAQTKKAEEILRTRIDDGTSTLSAITAKLADARRASDQSREELDALVSSATSEMHAARTNLEAAISDHRSEVARLSSDAAAIKVDFKIRFEEARDALDAMIKEHRTRTTGRVDEVVRDINEQLGSVRDGAEERVTALRDELVKAGETAERISTDLASAVELAQAHIRECQVRFARETESVQKQLTQLVERNKTALDATRTQVDGLTRQAGETAGTLRAEINLLKDSARLKIEDSGKEFEKLLAQATKRLDALRYESESVAGDLSERLAVTRDEATKAVTETEAAAGTLRQQSRNSLTEVRTCLLQMGERADQIRRELATVGDDIRESAKCTSDQIQRTGDRVAAQIETMREAAQRDADANHKRLALVRQQVEQSAEQVRENAAKLLDQVQNGAASLRRHADDMLAQAQAGSEKLSESAAVMLTQAQTASMKFREQAEALLHRAEATANSVRDEVQSLRSEISSDSEQIRQQITSAKHDLAETRQDTARIAADAMATQQRAQSKADQLLQRAEAVQKQSESLLSMPKELVEEANRQAVALSDMSKKVSTIVKQLATAESKAAQNRNSLEGASSAADEKLDLLKRHTERLGQLVGIIRQLYGTMDARIERLRGRLLQVDDLVRNVPRDIETLRAAFDSDEELMGMRPPAGRMSLRGVEGRGTATVPTGSAKQGKSAVASPQEGGMGTLVMAPPRTAAAVKAKAQSATKPAAPPATASPTKKSLGEVIQQNSKLNEWLQDVLGEGGAPATDAD